MTKEQNRWSQKVTENSDALDLEKGVFAGDDPKGIAKSLSRSAEESTKRKASPYRSAVSMLTFYINRAGKTLPQKRKRILEAAKTELRKLYHRA
jgi:phosphoenolpyruvate carboxylase